MRRALTVLALLVPSLSHAETTIGARVGGYGFREPHVSTGWQDCRMNGVGLFADRSLTPILFLEGGLDAYFAAPDDALLDGHSHDAMDRVSGLATIAGGIRPFPGARLSPYLQLGLGIEITRVTLDGASSSRALPLGFFGLGGDLALGRARLGAVFRMHAMGHFEHGTDAVEPELAAQLQFYAGVTL